MLKKLKGNQPKEVTVKSKAGLYRFLFVRGFSPAIIRQALNDGVDPMD